MGLKFCSFGSGSTGNSYLVRSETTSLLVDTGISGKRIMEGLSEAGSDLDDLSAILLTHEHSDHIMSIKMIARKAVNACVYGSRGTLESVSDKVGDSESVEIGDRDSFKVGDISITSFPLSHDASDPVGFSFENRGRKLSIITDTGIVTDDIFESIIGSDALILEANHEVNVLKSGPYPYELKRRILSDEGHLSNEAAGEVITRLLDERDPEGPAPKVMLAHISRQNNTPEMAYLTVRNVLFDHEYYVDKDVELSVAAFDRMSDIIEI